MRLKQGLMQVPPGMDIVTLLEFDGKSPEETPAPRGAFTLKMLRDRFMETHTGALEATTTNSMRLHFKHLVSTFGEGFPLIAISLADVQSHADRRKKLKWHGARIGPATIKKELVTFRTAWNWGIHMGFVSGTFPQLKRVQLEKADEPPPFQTRAEIDRAIAGLPPGREDDLWDSLYLTAGEIAELLRCVQEHATQPWLYPMVCLAAHTGMRRSEMIRALRSDVDLEGGTILVRERKRKQGQKTTRRVPLTPFLVDILTDWLCDHPGGHALFCQQPEVARSKKRSRTTGYKGDTTRATTVAGRLTAVTVREKARQEPVTRDEAHDHFKRTLAGSKWEVLRGYHVLRHSFISACASKGIDQRLIDEWVGHQTDEQRKRYRHLYPSVQRAAIAGVFA